MDFLPISAQQDSNVRNHTKDTNVEELSTIRNLLINKLQKETKPVESEKIWDLSQSTG